MWNKNEALDIEGGNTLMSSCSIKAPRSALHCGIAESLGSILLHSLVTTDMAEWTVS